MKPGDPMVHEAIASIARGAALLAGVTDRVLDGLALVLSIVRCIVEAHGGTIAAESSGRGKGATFTVTLPVAAVTAVQPEPPQMPGVDKPIRMIAPDRLRGVSLLLVDDDN